MIRYYCEGCDSYYEGGAEDMCCPVCSSYNVRIEEVY